MQPLEHARLFTLLELPGHVGPDLFRVDYPSMEDGPQEPSSRRESDVLKRVEQWSVATARAFALDCAERVVPILEWHAPDDDRPARLLASARAALGQGSFGGSHQQLRQDAGAYEAHLADDACHPAIAPAAGACVAAVRACVWGAVRAVVVLAAEAEANRVAWDAAWTAARDAAWFACTAAETDAQSAAAWDRAWSQTIADVRAWQASTLARHLGLSNWVPAGTTPTGLVDQAW